jgi:hypothetical protein
MAARRSAKPLGPFLAALAGFSALCLFFGSNFENKAPIADINSPFFGAHKPDIHSAQIHAKIILFLADFVKKAGLVEQGYCIYF